MTFGLGYAFFILLSLSVLMNIGIRILPDIISHYVLQIQIRKQSTVSMIMISFVNSCTEHNAGWTVYLKKKIKKKSFFKSLYLITGFAPTQAA